GGPRAVGRRGWARGVGQRGDGHGGGDGGRRFGGGGGQHVDEGPVAGRAVADEDLLDAAGDLRGPAGGRQQRGDGDDPAGRRVGELLGALLGGGGRVDGGDGGGRARGGVGGGGGRDGVGAGRGEPVARAPPRRREAGGHPPVEPVHLLVGEGGAARAVDERRGAAELGGPREHRVVDGQFDRRDVCVRAAEHGSSSRAGRGPAGLSTTWA